MPSADFQRENAGGASTSLSLLEQVRSADAEAWSRFTSIYAPLVYQWCRQWGIPADAAPDVVQDVLQSVVTHLHRFQRDRQPI